MAAMETGDATYIGKGRIESRRFPEDASMSLVHREGQVSQRLAELGESLAAARGAVDELNVRLYMMLQPEAPTPEADPTAAVAQVPLAEQLIAMTERAVGIARAARSIIDRLEL